MRRHALSIVSLLLASAAFAVSPASISYLPSAGKGRGKCIQGVCAQWVTSTWVLNPAAHDAHLTIAFLERDKDNSNPVSRAVTVLAGETVAFPDIMADPLGLDGVFGAIRFLSDTPVVVTGRIFDANVETNKGKGSAGQLFAGTPVLASIGTGQSTEVIGLAQDAAGAWRSNVGFVEVTGNAVTVRVRRLAGTGATLGEKSYAVLPFEAKQFNVDDLGGAAGMNQRVRFAITGGDGRIIAFGSRLDNLTGDPSTAEMTGLAMDPALIAGQWIGLWSNVTSRSTGPVYMTVTWDPATLVLRATVDVDGMVFGGANPAAETLSAALTGRGFRFTKSSSVFGQIDVTISGDGTISGSLGSVPSALVSSVDINGGATGDLMALAYIAHLVPSGSAVGVLYLEHQ